MVTIIPNDVTARTGTKLPMLVAVLILLVVCGGVATACPIERALKTIEIVRETPGEHGYAMVEERHHRQHGTEYSVLRCAGKGNDNGEWTVVPQGARLLQYAEEQISAGITEGMYRVENNEEMVRYDVRWEVREDGTTRIVETHWRLYPEQLLEELDVPAEPVRTVPPALLNNTIQLNDVRANVALGNDPTLFNRRMLGNTGVVNSLPGYLSNDALSNQLPVDDVLSNDVVSVEVQLEDVAVEDVLLNQAQTEETLNNGDMRLDEIQPLPTIE